MPSSNTHLNGHEYYRKRLDISTQILVTLIKDSDLLNVIESPKKSANRIQKEIVLKAVDLSLKIADELLRQSDDQIRMNERWEVE